MSRLEGIISSHREDILPTYINQLSDWPHFRWKEQALLEKLAAVRHNQGRLLGRMEGLGFKLREEATLETLTEEAVKTSEIEGEVLNTDTVRSSIARRLGMEKAAFTANVDRKVEAIVDVILDATRKYDRPLTDERLFDWHAALFPTGWSGIHRISVGKWRVAPIEVVSGSEGKQRIHFEGPPADRVGEEMQAFLKWFNDWTGGIDLVLKAGIAHFWFVTIHPFEDGNGRIARAIADMTLARSEKTPQRFYSISAQIRRERNKYYDCLEDAQKGDLDITDHLDWFLDCLDRAFQGAETTLANVLQKAGFWEKHTSAPLNDRQRKIVNMLLDGFEGKLTSSKWAKITKSSQATAGRDIDDLVKRKILVKDAAGGRSTSYSLARVAYSKENITLAPGSA
jgi:Fic family protein